MPTPAPPPIPSRRAVNANFWLALGVGLVGTILVYIALLPFQTSYLGQFPL